jgi:N-acetylglucosamine-6-phosphate deacetylase
MDAAIRNMAEFALCSPAEAMCMATAIPAEVLEIDDETGHLRPGYRADLVLLDKDLTVQGIFVNGERVF